MSIYIPHIVKFISKCRVVPAILALFLLLQPGQVSSQINAEDNVVYIFGQLVNNVNGAPISSHAIYIQSDSVSNSGFHYYSTLLTDVNGFFFDSIHTTNNDGFIDIYLYDFDENLVEASKHYRFNWSDKYQLEANFEIFDPNANQTTQANFESAEQEENELKVHFQDRSVGYVIKSWFWDFGDGNTSDHQDPVHEYAEPGIYDVTLLISSKPQGPEFNYTSKITKRVFVGLADYYDMGGHIFTGSFPIDYGSAYLYQIGDDNIPIAIDTASIDTLGYYYFRAVLEGNYIVKARLRHNSEKYGEFIPTYFGDTFDWEEARVIHHQAQNWNYHIHLIESDGTIQGSGSINGSITYDTNTITTTYSPAEDIEIILMDGENICLTCNLSDLQGNFKFQNINYGTYQIYPEVTGVHNESMYVTISEDLPGNDETFNIVIQPGQILFGIAESQSEMILGDVVFSPNPFRGKGNISMKIATPGEFMFTTIDLKGSVINQQAHSLDRGNHTIPLDISGHPSGLYHIIIRGTDGSATPLKVIKQ